MTTPYKFVAPLPLVGRAGVGGHTPAPTTPLPHPLPTRGRGGAPANTSLFSPAQAGASTPLTRKIPASAGTKE